MDFEMEILILALRKGMDIFEIPINVKYYTGEKRVSHFRPFFDNVLISLLYTRMCFSLMIYWPTFLFVRRKKRSVTYQADDR